MIIFINLTMVSSSDNFANKRHVVLKLSLVNVPSLNKLLRSEVSISEDRQLRVVHLILDYEPLSRIYQDAGQAIRAGDPRIHWIDILRPGFLAWEDLPPVELPLQRPPRKVVILREETASSCLSLEAEIDKFHFEEEEVQDRTMEISDSEADLNRSSTTHLFEFVVTRVDTNSEEEEEMTLNPKRGLRDLVVGRKGSSSKDAPQTQLPPNPPLPPLPSILGLHSNPNLQKKKRKGKEIKEEEIVPPKDPKQQKTTKDKRGSSVESKEDSLEAEVCRTQCT